MRKAAPNENNRANRATNSPKAEAVNTRQAATDQAVIYEYDRADQAVKLQKAAAPNRRETVRVSWQWCLPESVRGEACSCQDSREGGFHTSVALASTVLFGHL